MNDEAQAEDADLTQAEVAVELGDAKAWLDLIDGGRKAFEEWQLKCNNIDKLYASLERLGNVTREREFQLFWANIQILGPSIYSRPPVPVVTTRFKERDPIAVTSAELLERACVVTVETDDIDGTMLQVRDDLTAISRGQTWLRMEERDGKDWISVDFLTRRDFLHDPARMWSEVDWVARCAWLTRSQARKRFRATSGDAYRSAAYVEAKARRDDEDTGYKKGDTKLKAPFWELWSKSGNKVVWVAEGCEKVLDESEPYLDLERFFPCPKPAYGTTQRGTLIPVPDMLFYKDQLEEINEITGRIAALSEAVRVKGFYPAGAGNISDAIEAAVKTNNNNAMLIGISNWAGLGTGNAKDIVLWWPVEQIAAVIASLIELRKQLIDDVYQITGLSDIMRGSTVASETLGAQQLKSQYGSVRIRDRQNEMVRLARDIIRMMAESIAENYDGKTLLEMSQMKLPTDSAVMKQVMDLNSQKQQIMAMAEQAKNDPAIMAKMQENPDHAKQILQLVQEQITQLDAQIQQAQQTVTIDQCVKFLRDNKMRMFTLDIETDSTIQPDEDAQKQRATEYITAMSGLFQQAVPAVQQLPQMAPMLADMIKFANNQFRVGRAMSQSVEEFADQMKQMAGQQKPDAGQAEAQAKQAEMQAKAQLESERLNLEKDKAAKANEIDSKKLDQDWKTSLLQAATTLETAGMAAQSKSETEVLKGQIQSELNTQDKRHEIAMTEVSHAHEHDMTAENHAHEGDMAERSQEAAAEQAGTTSEAPARSIITPRVSSLLEQLKGSLGASQAPQAPTQDNSDILMAIAKLTQAIVAPQQITTPEGRTFTSQRMLH